MTIVNFMPVYRHSPVSLHLLKGEPEAAAAKLEEAAATDAVTAILPASEEALAAELRRLAPSATVLTADDSFGFVYTNDTACAALCRGEKPIPSEVTGAAEAAVMSGEAFLADDAATKLVWFEGAAEPVPVPAACTAEALVRAGGMDPATVKAVYIGYPSGRLVAASHLGDEVAVSSDYVRVYTNENCMANALREICDGYRQETCGRCVYGHEGSYQIATVLGDICRKKGRRGDLELLRDLAPVMRTQALCEVGRTMASTVLDFLDAFSDEIERHYTKNACPAGECPAYVTYHILPNLCVGCGDCVDACEEEAILGKPRFVHVIDQKACTQCGACASACDEGAIVTAGAEKPRTPPRPIPVRRR